MGGSCRVGEKYRWGNFIVRGICICQGPILNQRRRHKKEFWWWAMHIQMRVKGNFICIDLYYWDEHLIFFSCFSLLIQWDFIQHSLVVSLESFIVGSISRKGYPSQLTWEVGLGLVWSVSHLSGIANRRTLASASASPVKEATTIGWLITWTFFTLAKLHSASL